MQERPATGVGFLFILIGAAAVVGMGARSAEAINIQTVPVGNLANTADPDSRTDPLRGVVAYPFRIGKYEVTAGQYTAFLNAVAASDPNGLYDERMWSDPEGCKIQREGDSGSYRYTVAEDRANRPVNFVAVWDGMRLANWMHNQQPAGLQTAQTTEDGAYHLTEAHEYGLRREADARWALPTADEWHKAAYHKNNGDTGDYHTYPTASNSFPQIYEPGDAIINPDPGNYATCAPVTDWQTKHGIGAPYYFTEVGEHENSASAYGAFDMAGNVRELTQTILDTPYAGRAINVLGASFADPSLTAANLYVGNPGDSILYHQERANTGLRLVLIPEPGSAAILCGLSLGLVRRRR